MRARNIKPGFFRNEQLMQCPPLGRLLFAGLWCLADREGRLIDRPMQIKWDVLPADDCDIDALLDDLAARGFIRRYTVDGKRYIEVVNFLTHQRPHYKETASILPPPTISPVSELSATRLIPDCGYSDCGYSDTSSLDRDDMPDATAQTDMPALTSMTARKTALPSPNTRSIARSSQPSSAVSATDIQGSCDRIADLWQRLSGQSVTRAQRRLIERALEAGHGEGILTDLLHAKHLEYHTARSKKNFTLANLLGAKLPHHLAGLGTSNERTAPSAPTPSAKTRTAPSATAPSAKTRTAPSTPAPTVKARTTADAHHTDWTSGFFGE